MNKVPEYERCKNCFGTGTVFTGRRRLVVTGSKKCPVCKGKCKVEITPSKEQKK